MSPSNSNGNGSGWHLRLRDVSDLDLLEAIDRDHANDEGWAWSVDVGKAFKIPEEFAARVCGARFAWMKRFGWLEYDGEGRWRVTPIGASLIDGTLPRDIQDSIKRMSDGEKMRLTRMLSQMAGQARRQPVQTMYRREWTRNAIDNRRR